MELKTEAGGAEAVFSFHRGGPAHQLSREQKRGREPLYFIGKSEKQVKEKPKSE